MTWQWPSDYNAEISMQKAMEEAGVAMEKTNGPLSTELASVYIANADLWIQVAQVHATNMLTEAVKVAFPSSCVCPPQ